MDGNGGCCIARWTDGGHVANEYDAVQMDRIMLKFRPIAPKPASANAAVGSISDNSSISPRDGRHAKGAARGRRKCGNKENNSNSKNCNNGRKRKSSSPVADQRAGERRHDLDQRAEDSLDVEGKEGVTLLPLFPEAPDLSPTNQEPKVPMWLNFDYNDINTPIFENNYGQCHGQGW